MRHRAKPVQAGEAPPLGQLVVDLAGAQQQGVHLRRRLRVGENRGEAAVGKLRQGTDAGRQAQQALRGEDDQRPPVGEQHLAAQQVEELGRGARVGDLQVLLGTEREVALDAGAGVLRALPLVAVGEEQDQAAGAVPLGDAAGDELVDDHLGAVGEVAELRLPDGQPLGHLQGVAVLEAEHRRLGEHAVVDLHRRLAGGEEGQRHIGLAALLVDDQPHGAG